MKRKSPKLGSIRLLAKKLWELCKAIIRARYALPDGTWLCYTCGHPILIPKNAQTGHYIHSSVCSVELRYDLKNLRIQCFQCNINKSGNTLEYEERLIRDNGPEYVQELKIRNRQTKGKQYDQLWYRDKIADYKLILEKSV